MAPEVAVWFSVNTPALTIGTTVPSKKTAKKSTRTMTEEHKQALAEGRRQGKAVRDYLAALEAESHKPRGRKPTQDPSEIQAQIDVEPDPSKRLDLIQKRLDIEERLAAESESADLDALEKDFVAAVKPYAERKGISYSALREAGVPAAVLKDAGIARTRRTSA
jgi:hypothetical protein